MTRMLLFNLNQKLVENCSKVACTCNLIICLLASKHAKTEITDNATHERDKCGGAEWASETVSEFDI